MNYDKMTYKLSYKNKQFFFALVKICIVAGAFYFIYEKLTTNEDLNLLVFTQFLTENTFFSTKSIVFLSILSIFNWFFEISKWQILVSELKSISLKTSTEQSLGALTASLFTPNRIGEYGAKAIYYKKKLRKRILLINLISNIMQMSVTCILGIIGFCFMIAIYPIHITSYKLTFIIFISLIILGLLSFVVLNSKFKINGFSIEKLMAFIKEFDKSKLSLGLLYSFLRYLIFSFQFYFLLIIFEVDITYLNAMMVITSMYLVSSIIPSIFIFDVVVKGGIALYLFTFVGVNSLTILSVITLMWLFNFVLPSLVGGFYVLNFKLPKEKD